jgi:uncharacterized protein (DUF1697 family)
MVVAPRAGGEERTGVTRHVALLRGVNNVGGRTVAMAELRALVASLGHTDVQTYIQSGNVLFTPPATLGSTDDAADPLALAVEMETAILLGLGIRARVVVLSREDLAISVRNNPFPEQRNPKLLHAVFLPDPPQPELGSWLADAERGAWSHGSRDQVRIVGRTVYLHTPQGFPESELRRTLARAGGPTSTKTAGTARNWATVTRLLELCDNPSA